MKNTRLLRWLWIATTFEGLLAIFQLAGLGAPAGGLAGGRMVLLALAGLSWLAVLLIGGWVLWPRERADLFVERGRLWLEAGVRYPAALAGLLALGLFSLEGILFSYMFWPAYVRGLMIWGLLTALQGLVGLVWALRPAPGSRAAFWPNLTSLERQRKKVLMVLLLVGLAYFVAFIPFNLSGAKDAGQFLVNGGDEVVIYPILTTMLTPGPELRTTLYRIIEYDDYHYGYPFYALSALVLLPVRLALGPGFDAATQLNLFLLRQLISVLPLVLAALVLTYLATRFRSLPGALLTFVLILSVPGVVRSGLRFWHPDGLGVLFVALTFYFFRRDRLRLGGNFYLAALFCGLATAVRLVGFFFVLAVGGYLLVGWLRERAWLRTLVAGAGFIAVLVFTIFISDPFLFDAGARGRMLNMMADKSVEMTQGYKEPDPEQVYRTGFDAWAPFFEKDYAQTWFSGFLLASTILAALTAKQRTFPALLLGWTVVMGGYLVFFVAAKAFQYSLPLFMPLYAAAFFLPQLVLASHRLQPRTEKFILWATYGLCFIQLVINVYRVVNL